MRACHGCACKRAQQFQTRILAFGGFEALIYSFSAAVSFQVMCWLYGWAQKLPLRGSEGRSKSGRAGVKNVVCQLGINAFKRDIATLALERAFATLAHAYTRNHETHTLYALRASFSRPSSDF